MCVCVYVWVCGEVALKRVTLQRAQNGSFPKRNLSSALQFKQTTGWGHPTAATGGGERGGLTSTHAWKRVQRSGSWWVHIQLILGESIIVIRFFRPVIGVFVHVISVRVPHALEGCYLRMRCCIKLRSALQKL